VVLEPVGMVQEDDFAGNLDVGESAGAAFSDLELSEDIPDARVEQVDTGLAGPSSTGGQLDVDSNVNCDNDGGVENIFWPPGDAPSGGYTVTVTGYQLTADDGSGCGSGDYTLSITVAGDERTQTGTVAQDEEQPFTFEVP
jgi:hypothetical protein